jgi:hypothetical protein
VLTLILQFDCMANIVYRKTETKEEDGGRVERDRDFFFLLLSLFLKVFSFQSKVIPILRKKNIIYFAIVT